MQHVQRTAPFGQFLRSVAGAASIALIGALATGCASSDSKSKSPAPGTAEISRQAVAKVTVVSVDKTARSMTLKNNDGKSFTVQAGPEVTNFDQIRAGDSVTLRYTESVAVALVKPGSAITPAGASISTNTGEQGKKSDSTVTGQITATVRIDSVDTKKNIVVFTGPKGDVQLVDVVTPEGKEFIKGLKPGDQVQITYTAAVAVSVEKQ